MRLTFAGTRGYIGPHTPEHERHSSLLFEYRRHTVLVDCGEDRLGHLDQLGSPEAGVVDPAQRRAERLRFSDLNLNTGFPDPCLG